MKLIIILIILALSIRFPIWALKAGKISIPWQSPVTANPLFFQIPAFKADFTSLFLNENPSAILQDLEDLALAYQKHRLLNIVLNANRNYPPAPDSFQNFLYQMRHTASDAQVDVLVQNNPLKFAPRPEQCSLMDYYFAYHLKSASKKRRSVLRCILNARSQPEPPRLPSPVFLNPSSKIEPVNAAVSSYATVDLNLLELLHPQKIRYNAKKDLWLKGDPQRYIPSLPIKSLQQKIAKTPYTPQSELILFLIQSFLLSTPAPEHEQIKFPSRIKKQILFSIKQHCIKKNITAFSDLSTSGLPVSRIKAKYFIPGILPDISLNMLTVLWKEQDPALFSTLLKDLKALSPLEPAH
jgi:hypothetical protein